MNVKAHVRRDVLSVYGAGTKRKFAAPATVPLAELPIKDANIQPGRPQAGKLTHPSIQQQQQQGPAANTRQKKKPRVAFGRRVGTTVNRRAQESDTAADSLEANQTVSTGDEAANLQSSSVVTGRNKSASRLAAIVQASEAISCRSAQAQAEGAKPSGNSAQEALEQAVAGHSQAAAAVASQALESVPNLAKRQGGQAEAAQAQPEVARSEHPTWQAPYNHAAYADDSFHSPPSISKAMHAALPGATSQPTAATAFHSFNPSAMLHVPQVPSQASDLPSGIRMSAADLQLQQQYDALLTDFATQQQQQSQLPAVRHSRFEELHQPPAVAKPSKCVVHAIPSSAASLDKAQAVTSSAASLGRALSMKAVQAEPSRADASTSPLAGEQISAAYPASQVVVLPDDPFQQQLPQHLRELSQHPDQLLQHAGEQSQHPQQKPELLSGLSSLSYQLMQQLSEEGELPQQQLQLPVATKQLQQYLMDQTQLPLPQFGLLSELSQLRLKPQPAASLSLAGSQPELQQPVASFTTVPAQDLLAPALAQITTQQQQYQPQNQLQLQPELLQSDVVSALPRPGSSAPLQAAASASAIQDTVNNQEAGDSHSRDVDARLAAHTKLLRASLAEWLADAVASKLWSALEQRRLASNPAEAQDQEVSDSSRQAPGDNAQLQSFHLMCFDYKSPDAHFLLRLIASIRCRSICTVVDHLIMQCDMNDVTL